MSKDKQIEEMAKVLCKDCARDALPCSLTITGIMCDAVMEQAEALYSAGYRKASDVAREIFEELEKIAIHGTTFHGLCLMSMGEVAFAELKKKYTEGVENEKV